ncbi:MAG: hypothetical protein AAGL29_07575 [Bacteroidota bacterium]
MQRTFYFLGILFTTILVSCDSDDVANDVVLSPDVGFNDITIVAAQLDERNRITSWHQIDVDENEVVGIQNLSQEYGFEEDVLFRLDTNENISFIEDSFSASDGNAVKLVSKNISSGESQIVQDFYKIVETNNRFIFMQSSANKESIFTLHYENELVGDESFDMVFFSKVNSVTSSMETLWSARWEQNGNETISIGSGESSSGITVTDKYYVIDYSKRGTNTSYHIEVYDLRTNRLIKSFESDVLLDLLIRDDMVCISDGGILELYNLQSKQSKKFENDDLVGISLTRPGFGFVDKDYFIFGTSFGNRLPFPLITLLDFNSNQIVSLDIVELFGEQLDHLGSNLSVMGESYFVDFERRRILISYSYQNEGEKKYELASLTFEGEVLDYMVLPQNYSPKAVLFN